MNIIETVDFNDDTQFLGKDLDISWAYLQTKKLFELGDTTITSQTFKQKVIDQYNLNKNSGIAEASDLDITRLPGDLADGAAAPSKKLNFKKLWIFNSIQKPGQVFESMLGEYSTPFTKSFWTSSVGADEDLIWLNENGGEIELDDGGDLRSDRNWTFYMEGKIRNLVVTGAKSIFRKGNFEVALDKLNDTTTRARISSSGGSWNSRIHNYFENSTTDAELNNQSFSIAVVREGLSIRLFINGSEWFKSIPGDQPEPIFGADMVAPITLRGDVWSRLDKVYISELDFVGGDVVTVSGDYRANSDSYTFAHDMDIDNSFFAFKQYFPDKFGSFARVFYAKYGPDAPAQTHWVTPPSLDTSNGYVAKDKCIGLTLEQTAAGKIPQYMSCPSVDFRKDFTISFWVSFASTFTKFLRITGENGVQLTLQMHWEKSEENGIKMKLGDTEKTFNVKGIGAGADAKWQHITIIKSGDYLSLWANGKYGDTSTYFTLSDEDKTNMGGSSVEFYTENEVNKLYLSHVRILKYAVSHIPVNGVGNRTNWTFINKLQEPINPGSVGNT